MAGTHYRIRNEEEVFKTFASNFERNTQTAYEELRADKIIEEYRNNPVPYYTLNFSEKGQQIQAIIKSEPFDTVDFMHN